MNTSRFPLANSFRCLQSSSGENESPAFGLRRIFQLSTKAFKFVSAFLAHLISLLRENENIFRFRLVACSLRQNIHLFSQTAAVDDEIP